MVSVFVFKTNDLGSIPNKLEKMKYVPLISLGALAQTQSPHKISPVKKQIKEKQLYAQLPLDPTLIL